MLTPGQRLSSRRSLARAIALAMAWAGLVAQPAAAQSAPRPNIIVIVADDLGYGDPGFMGQADILTPEIDDLAAEGMVFDQMYAGAPSCAPSRAVHSTGLHPGHNTVDRNATPNTPTRPEDITVGHVLKAVGYDTYVYGKWGLGGANGDPELAEFGTPNPDGMLRPGDSQTLPANKGFDRSLVSLDQRTAHNFYPEWLWRGIQTLHGTSSAATGTDATSKETIAGNFGEAYWDPDAPGNNLNHLGPGDRTVNMHDLWTDEVLSLIQAADGSTPFYIQLWYTYPHRETQLPPATHSDGQPSEDYASESWPAVDKAFAAMVSYLDYDIGRVIDAVDANPAISGDTLIIFTSDNGPQQTDGHTASFFDSSGGLRGRKFQLYEGGIRVPFVARWTGTISPGSSSSYVGGFEDFMPTFAELAGGQSPSGIDGISFEPTLTGEGVQGSHDFLYRFHPGSQRHAVRQGDWKLLQMSNGNSELYDLASDSDESNNVAGANPEIVADLEAIITQEDTGPIPVLSPVLVLGGDAAGSGSAFSLDFGAVPIGSGPVSLTFHARNGAAGYANLMNGEVLVDGITDPRLSVETGEFVYLVDGAASRDFTVTFDPSSGGPLVGQTVTVEGTVDWYGGAAVNGPVTLTIKGTAGDAPPPDPTVAYYRFDDDAVPGSTEDETGDHGGTLLGSPGYSALVGQDPLRQTGLANDTALDLELSSSQYVEVPHAANLSFGNAPWTIEAFIRPESLPTASDAGMWIAQKKAAVADESMDYGFLIAGSRANNTTGLFSYARPDQDADPAGYPASGRELQVEFGVGSAIKAFTSTLQVPAAGTWVHVSAAYDGNRSVRFTLDVDLTDDAIDFEETVAASGAVTPTANTGSLFLGAKKNSTGLDRQHFDGLIDEVRISSGVLDWTALLPVAPPQPAAVPALSAGGRLLLALLLAGVCFRAQRPCAAQQGR